MAMARAMRNEGKRKPATVPSENYIQAALTRLDRAESLSKQGKLDEALSEYEVAIGNTIGIVNELKKSQHEGNGDESNKTSRDVLMSRARVALTDAESLKEKIKQKKEDNTLKVNEELAPSRNLVRKSPQRNARPKLMTSFSERFFAPAEVPIRKVQSTLKPIDSAKMYGGKRQTPSKIVQKKSNLNYTSDDPFIATIKADMYVDSSTLTTRWDDISGLTTAKRSLQEAAILPLLRPDLYTGLRSPPRGILLYGPPGTGKTMLVKAVAHESQCILFACSASAMTSKWVGEGEKLVRTLFRFALDVAPSIVFLDEMDSLLGRRKSDGNGEGESSRRFKTEFMVQMEGITAGSGNEGSVEKRMLVIGCTNCPWDIDDAVMRRFQRRIYVPLPDKDSRLALWNNIVIKANGGNKPRKGEKGNVSVTTQEVKQLVKMSQGFSCSDVASIANEASFGPLRDIGGMEAIRDVKSADVRPILARDFTEAIKNSKKSVSNELLKRYQEWEQAQAAGGS